MATGSKSLNTAASLRNAISGGNKSGAPPFTVFIEGNIGSGKTTFLNYFQKYDEVCLQTEPVEKWRNLGGVNLLVSIFSFLRNGLNAKLSNWTWNSSATVLFNVVW